jgi:SAM-dependent methyltransferase
MLTNPRRWLPKLVVDLYDKNRFDVANAWGVFRQEKYPINGLEYLQVGCGDRHIKDFLNTDHFGVKKLVFNVDIRYPLPFDDARWKGIFAHHVVEHISLEKARMFFREARRCLSPGGTLRVVVPDVEKFIRLYSLPAGERVKALEAIIPLEHLVSVDPRTAMGFVNWATYSSAFNEHRFSWDFETMSGELRNCEFSAVLRSECGQSTDPKMSNIDTPHWADHSLYVEALK